MFAEIGFAVFVVLIFGGGYYVYKNISKEFVIFAVIMLLEFPFLYPPITILLEHTKQMVTRVEPKFDLSFILTPAFYLPIIICVIMNITLGIIVNKLIGKYERNQEEHQKEDNDNE